MRKIAGMWVLAALAVRGGGSLEAGTVTENPVATVDSPAPEQVAWCPSGDAVWVSVVDDLAGVSSIGRYPVVEGAKSTVTLQGTIRAFWVSPDGRKMASIHEDRSNRVLQIWDSEDWTSEEIHRDTWNLYFPFVNTVTPWNSSGERLLFYKARFHERKLCLWERSKSAVRVIGEGRRTDRAFWGPGGNLLIPQGLTLEQALAGGGDPIQGFEEFDPESGERRERPIPSDYRAFFPFVPIGVGILKDETPPPLLLDLRSWETSSLPSTLDRFLEVAWAPNGEWLAHPVRGSHIHRIDAFNVKTRESKLLWINSQYQVGSLTWSPSGKYLGCSLLEGPKGSKGSQEQIMVLDAASGDPVWFRNRDPDLGSLYHRRGRKSLLWHPKQDRLLIWDRVDSEGDRKSVEFRLIDFAQ